MDEYLSKETNYIMKRLEDIEKYIEQNPDSDPNTYEMMDIIIMAGRRCKALSISSESKNKNHMLYAMNDIERCNIRNKCIEVMCIRMNDMENPKNDLNITFLNPMVILFKRALYDLEQFEAFVPNSIKGDLKKDRLCSLVGVYLYVKQRLRDIAKKGSHEIVYDNYSEYLKLQQYFSSSDDDEIRAIFAEISENFMKKI